MCSALCELQFYLGGKLKLLKADVCSAMKSKVKHAEAQSTLLYAPIHCV